MAKHVYGIRFKPQVYNQFKKVAKAQGYTATGAFEQFMTECIEADKLVFSYGQQLDFEFEARILTDWLGKGQVFYRSEQGEEVNIRGRLLWLIPRLADKALKCSVEAALKTSVAEKQTN